MLVITALAQPSCVILGKQIKLPDSEVCAVAGVMSAGADCVHMVSSGGRSMTLDELIEFLEPQDERIDLKTGKKLPKRPPAMIMSAEEWNKQKTVLEQACTMLGDRCTIEMKQTISTVSGNIQSLFDKSISKRPKKK